MQMSQLKTHMHGCDFNKLQFKAIPVKRGGFNSEFKGKRFGNFVGFNEYYRNICLSVLC